MKPLAIARAPSACEVPLTIARILAQGVARAPAQEIVCGNVRLSYAKFAESQRPGAAGRAR